MAEISTGRNIASAYKIATACLRNCYSEYGILAGRTHFSDHWARDSFFASFGACKLKDFSIVKKNLQLFLKHQADDGQIPLRIGTYNLIPKMLGLSGKQELKPRYTVDTILPNKAKATDPNSLFVIAFANYMRESEDIAFTKDNYKKIKKAIDWNFTQDDDGDLLLEDKGLTTWDDRTFKKGKVIYTNILHFKALEDFSFIASSVGDKKNSDEYKQLALAVKEKINPSFWNGTFYADMIEKDQRLDYFSFAGNSLAALWLADREKIRKIEKAINVLNHNDNFSLKVVYPPYNISRTYLPNILLGFADYHTHMLWPWIACFYSIGLNKVDKSRSFRILENVAAKIVEYNNCYEVYEENGTPVNRWFYKSEQPFAWFAGSFIYACHELYKQK